MEDAEGEVLSLTEEYPTNDHFKVRDDVTIQWYFCEMWDDILDDILDDMSMNLSWILVLNLLCQ